MATRTTYTVTHDKTNDTWRVQKEGASRASAVCETREEAIGVADEFARHNQPSRVIQDQRGTLTQLESVYGDI